MTDSEPYVHRPNAPTDAGDAAASAVAGDAAATAPNETPGEAATAAGPTAADPVNADQDDADGFGDRGWVLVGVVVFSFLVVPGAIYLFPSAPAEAGLPFFAAMLALPLVPAALLGLTAVWSMTAATRGDREHD